MNQTQDFIKKLLLVIILAGCTKPERKYVVVSSFNETILETNDMNKAYETAHNLTMMGRVLASKPDYFVMEKPRQ